MQDESGSDFDDDDLIAEGPKMPGGSAFASVTMGLSRAFMATHRMFERAVKKAQRLPKLGQQ